jgi:hypothetical protein
MDLGVAVTSAGLNDDRSDIAAISPDAEFDMDWDLEKEEEEEAKVALSR